MLELARRHDVALSCEPEHGCSSSHGDTMSLFRASRSTDARARTATPLLNDFAALAAKSFKHLGYAKRAFGDVGIRYIDNGVSQFEIERLSATKYFD
jgi:hypothetical protein